MKLQDLQYKPGHYLAFVLSEHGRAELLRVWIPRYKKTICHHVTVEFHLDETKLDKIIAELFPKQDGKLIVRATGELYDEEKQIQCVTISINGETKRPSGGFYHVTYSLTPPTKPVESNDLLGAHKGEPMNRVRGIINVDGSLQLVKK